MTYQLDISQIETAELDLSTICDAKCPLCFRNKKNFPKKYKTPFFREYNDIIVQLNSFTNLKCLQLCGQMSEPTLYPRLFDLIKYAKNRNLKIILYTNGNSGSNDLYKSIGQLLTQHDNVIFTVCGYTDKMHAHYRIGTSLKNIISHARALREIIPIDKVKCIVFQYNYSHIYSITFKSFISQFSNIEIINTSLNDHNLYNANFIYNDFYPVKQKINFYNTIITAAKIKRKIICDSLITKNVQIDPFGKIYPCYIFLENNFNMEFNMDYSLILANKIQSCRFCSDLCLKYVSYSEIN